MNHEILTNELDENTKALIEKVEKMENKINEKDKELSSKDEEIRKLKNEVDFLKGVISNKNRKIFGASSEQVDVNQLSFFNEAEKFSDTKAEEPTLEEITYKRAKKSNYIGISQSRIPKRNARRMTAFVRFDSLSRCTTSSA